MKISIITVVFNGENSLEDCIKSVKSQKYENIEYLIIDGKSTDNTLNIINKYKNSIDVFISEQDNGIYDAMNKGIRLASGEIIGILNSDDLYQNENVICEIMNQFSQNSSLDIVYGDLVYVKNDNINEVVRNWKSLNYEKYFFEKGNVPPHPTLFLKKMVYEEVGLFDLQFKLAADYELMLRIFKKYNFQSKYINKILVRMRLGGTTNKNIMNIFNQNKEILHAWKKNCLSVPFFLMPLRFIKRLNQFI